MPNLAAKKTKPKKEPKKVLVEKEQLSRVNRNITCNYCETEKILNPDQYQARYDIYGDEETLKSEFMCKNCEMEMKRNPIAFWTIHGEIFHTLSKNIKNIFDSFKNSNKGPTDVLNLQNFTTKHLFENSIHQFEFVIKEGLPISLKIKQMPFVGTVTLNVYEQRKNRIVIGG